MSLEGSFLEKLRQLPPDKQREVLDFVEFLQKKNAAQGVTTGGALKVFGLTSDLA
jgi:hypothetical protein